MKTTTAPQEFVVYSHGLIYASVCTSLSAEEATTRINELYTAGTTNGWKLADESFRTGEANPHPCHDHPDTHKHYLFNC